VGATAGGIVTTPVAILSRWFWYKSIKSLTQEKNFLEIETLDSIQKDNLTFIECLKDSGNYGFGRTVSAAICGFNRALSVGSYMLNQANGLANKYPE